MLSALLSWFGINSITLLWIDYKEKFALMEHECMGSNLTAAEGFILGVGAKMFSCCGARHLPCRRAASSSADRCHSLRSLDSATGGAPIAPLDLSRGAFIVSAV